MFAIECIACLLIAFQFQTGVAWIEIKLPANEKAQWVSGKGSPRVLTMWMTTQSGKLYHWETPVGNKERTFYTGSWVERSIKVNNKMVKASRVSQSYTDEIAWAISDTNEVYVFDKDWTKVPGGKLDEITSFDLKEAYGIYFNHEKKRSQIFKIQQKKFVEFEIPPRDDGNGFQSARCSSITVSPNHDVYVTSGEEVYKYKDGKWVLFGIHPSILYSLDMKQIDIYSTMVATSSSEKPFISFLEDSVNRYKIYRVEPGKNKFVQIEGGARQVCAAADKIFAVNIEGQLFWTSY